jgi:hypothetical protein
VSVAIYLFFVFLLLQNKRRRQQHFKMGFFTSTAAGQQPMDKTSENEWMESIVPPFSPPDVDDTNSAIAGAARNCCPAFTVKVGL